MKPFCDPDKAREAALKSVEVRRQQAEERPSLKRLLEELDEDEGKPRAEVLAMRLYEAAKGGDLRAGEYLLSQYHGRPKQAIDVEARREPDESALTKFVEMMDEARGGGGCSSC